MTNLRTYRCHFEQLERRELMAGLETERLSLTQCMAPQEIGPSRAKVVYVADSAGEETFLSAGSSAITIESSKGVLTIRGDAGNNGFTIYGVPSIAGATASHLSSVSIMLHYGTRVSNDTRFNPNLYFPNVREIVIDLGDGNDVVRIEGAVKGPLTINTGAGNDEVKLLGNETSVAIVGWTSYYTPPAPLAVSGDLNIDTGAGDDRLAPFVNVEGDTNVQMGDGDDVYIELPYPTYMDNGEVIGKATATGAISIDLGADQDIENIPENWQDDPALASKISAILPLFDYYQGMLDRGEAQPGQEAYFRPTLEENWAHVDAQGKLDVYFSFAPGFAPVVERLIARGVQVGEHWLSSGSGWAQIGVNDLRLLANLPGLEHIFPRAAVPPGSPPAEVISGPVQTPTHPAFGPIRVTDAPQNTSLRESYYGENFVFGPQRL